MKRLKHIHISDLALLNAVLRNFVIGVHGGLMSFHIATSRKIMRRHKKKDVEREYKNEKV
jgi:hypothetical protein